MVGFVVGGMIGIGVVQSCLYFLEEVDAVGWKSIVLYVTVVIGCAVIGVA